MRFLLPVACAAFLLQLGASAFGLTLVRYSDFGAVGDGVTDDFEALVKAHTYANENDLPVVADEDATYYIGGAATKTTVGHRPTPFSWTDMVR